MKTVEEIALAVCEKIGPVAFSEIVAAAVDAERGEDAVAWVDVVDRHEGPYKFHGKELLDSGKHNLYTTPQPTQMQAGAVPLTDEQVKALMQAHRTAMLMTCKARVPECGEFAAIAQDLDWLCESLGIKGG